MRVEHLIKSSDEKVELLRFFRVFKGDKAAAMFGVLPHARVYRLLHTRSLIWFLKRAHLLGRRV